MSHPRTRLTLEHLETRDVPSSATSTTQTFDAASSALPAGWAQRSNDGSTAFATVAGVGVGGTGAAVTSGGSKTAALAWQTQAVAGDTAVSVDVNLTSLVPTFVFARGSNLATATPSYLAAVVTRGATVSVIQVTDGTAKVLGTVTSPAASYFSGSYVEVSLVPNGSSVGVQVMRADTGQYLNAQGKWQSAATNALTVTTTLADAASDVGIGRAAGYAGAVDFDNFAITPPASSSSTATGSQSFDTTTTGTNPTGWQSWTSNTAGGAGVIASTALSPSNSYAFTGSSTTAARAWSTTVQPANVTASVAVDVNSLVPAQLFVSGSNLNTATPSYTAVTITRGLQASLVQVVNGKTTTLATLTSTSYFSGQWAEVQLTAQGTNVLVSIYRTDTKQWLTASGTWSSAPAYAFNVSNAVSLAAGQAGIGRSAGYAGTINFDNFTAGAAGSAGPVVSVTSSTASTTVSGTVTFKAAAGTGAVGNATFVLNGQIQATPAASAATWTLNTATLANGTYTLTVLAGNSDGTVGAATYTFTVANSVAATSTPQKTIAANPAAAVAYSPAPAADTLFGANGPSYLDVEQQQSGDCWLIASLAEVAATDPQAIKDMFTYDGTTKENGATVGAYTVRFYNSSGTAVYVTVDTQLPGGGGYYDQPVNGVLWVALAEKAYAVANGLGYVTSSNPKTNSYAALNNGTASWALRAITGNTASDSFTSASQIIAALQAGKSAVLATGSPSDSHILANHAYAVVGYNATTGLFTLMNPWGGTTTSNVSPENGQIYGLFTANAAFLAANFTVQSIGA